MLCFVPVDINRASSGLRAISVIAKNLQKFPELTDEKRFFFTNANLSVLPHVDVKFAFFRSKLI
jgi:hypothetical protein